MKGRISELYGGMAWRSLGLVAICALFAASLLAFSRPIVMLVDGERVDSDVPPVTTANAKAFVPLRSIADALGAETEVDGKRMSMEPGEWVFLPRGTPHKVLRTGLGTSWLAVQIADCDGRTR